MFLSTNKVRKDGRSDGQVIYDFAIKLKENEILSYEILLNELQKDVESVKYDKSRVYSAINSANKKLLKFNFKYLAVVRGVGYKLIPANEHISVALSKKRSAQRSIKKGQNVLEFTNLNELNPTERMLHEQHMNQFRNIELQLKYHDQRMTKQDNLIENLLERIEKLEND